MATIDSLKESFLLIPHQEALDIILSIRRSRQVVKKTTKTSTKKVSAKTPSVKKAQPTLKDFVNTLTPEQKAQLLAKLTGGSK